MPTNAETAPGFWRCRRCGTPNPRAAYLTMCLGCGRPIPREFSGETASQPPPTEVATRSPRRGRKTLIASAIYAGVVLASVGMIRGLALGWWPVAALIFMPRWLFLVPILPLAVGAIRSKQARVLALVGLDALLVLGPLMGFSVPIGRMIASSSSGPRVRMMTFNQGAARLDVPRLIRYLDRYQIDVVCLQEPGKSPDLFESLIDKGWHMDQDRRIASRFPIVGDLGRSADVNKSDSRYTMTLFRARLRHPSGFEFLVGCVHLPTPRKGLERLMARDIQGLRMQLAWWDEEAGRLRETIEGSDDSPIFLAGDFNMPSDYSTMGSFCSAYPSAYEEAGWGYGYTRPTALPWVRIDHVLASRDWDFTRAWVGPDLGSDHLPLIAEAVLVTKLPRK